MKRKVFEVRIDDTDSGQVDTGTIIECLNSIQFIHSEVEVLVIDATESEREANEKSTYLRLLEKVNSELDPDSCVDWAMALKNFCEAINARNGG